MRDVLHRIVQPLEAPIPPRLGDTTASFVSMGRRLLVLNPSVVSDQAALSVVDMRTLAYAQQVRGLLLLMSPAWAAFSFVSLACAVFNAGHDG